MYVELIHVFMTFQTGMWQEYFLGSVLRERYVGQGLITSNYTRVQVCVHCVCTCMLWYTCTCTYGAAIAQYFTTPVYVNNVNSKWQCFSNYLYVYDGPHAKSLFHMNLFYTHVYTCVYM